MTRPLHTEQARQARRTEQAMATKLSPRDDALGVTFEDRKRPLPCWMTRDVKPRFFNTSKHSGVVTVCTSSSKRASGLLPTVTNTLPLTRHWTVVGRGCSRVPGSLLRELVSDFLFSSIDLQYWIIRRFHVRSNLTIGRFHVTKLRPAKQQRKHRVRPQSLTKQGNAWSLWGTEQTGL